MYKIQHQAHQYIIRHFDENTFLFSEYADIVVVAHEQNLTLTHSHIRGMFTDCRLRDIPVDAARQFDGTSHLQDKS